MSRQVAARLAGDNYQSRFFWYQAAKLLCHGSYVERVVLEHDTASGVDDVVVYYRKPGILNAGALCTAQYFQVKYHVDQRDAYSSDAMVDPAFISGRASLLERFFGGFQAEREAHPGLLLALVSNWTWRPDDPLATAIRDCDGSLPLSFFSCGPRSALGKVREKWQATIQASPGEFLEFARRLRLKLNYLSRGDLLEVLSDRLHLAGLRPIDEAKQVVPYDDLAAKFIMNGQREFDAKSLRDLCRAEGLVTGEPLSRNARTFGIRSYMRFAEHLEDECDAFVCVAENFDGRTIRSPELWFDRVLPDLRRFLRTPAFRRDEHQLLMECHLSVAYAAGYLLDRTTGAEVYPIQKGRARAVWKPSTIAPGEFAATQWQSERRETTGSDEALVLAVSITHEVHDDVETWLSTSGLDPRAVIYTRPVSGVGASSLRGPDHAAALAEQLQQMIAAERRRWDRHLTVHLFPAAPTGFMYFLGQLGRSIDPVQLYEFDFDGRTGYSASLCFPVAV